MLANIAMCAVLVLIAAAITNEMVQLGGFWGALVMTGCFAVIANAAASAC